MKNIKMTLGSDVIHDRFSAEIRLEDSPYSLVADVEKVESGKIKLSTSGLVTEVDAQRFLELLDIAIEELKTTT